MNCLNLKEVKADLAPQEKNRLMLSKRFMKCLCNGTDFVCDACNAEMMSIHREKYTKKEIKEKLDRLK